MLARAFAFFERIYPTNDEAVKERKNLKKRKEILRRQKKLMEEEINQKWRITMGIDIPKKLKGTFLIENITRRNVWMEDNFIFNEIKKQFPDEIFHPIDCYVLKWQPPNSYFQTIIPMNDAALQENAILIVNSLLKPQQDTLLFHFTTLDPSLPLYAPRVHPSSLLSYRTKNEVLKKLSDFFLQGKISVEEIQQILTCDVLVWKNALYNLLPEDEQIYHTYLNEKPIEEIQNQTKAKDIQSDYIAEHITLAQYEQFMYPERFHKQQIESMNYPLPIEGIDCVICGQEKQGVIKCYTCDNMVCVACVRRVFQGEHNNTTAATTNNPSDIPHMRQSFLLMHHRFCMKLGELPVFQLEILSEPVYLKTFRTTARTAVITALTPNYQPDYDDFAPLPEDEEDEEEKNRLLAIQRAHEEAEQSRIRQLLLENPYELQQLQRQYDERMKRLERQKKHLLDLCVKIADVSQHTEAFITRNKRLKEESRAKLIKSIQIPLQEIGNELETLQETVPGEYLPALQVKVQSGLNQVEELLDM